MPPTEMHRRKEDVKPEDYPSRWNVICKINGQEAVTMGEYTEKEMREEQDYYIPVSRFED